MTEGTKSLLRTFVAMAFYSKVERLSPRGKGTGGREGEAVRLNQRSELLKKRIPACLAGLTLKQTGQIVCRKLCHVTPQVRGRLQLFMMEERAPI